MGIMLLKESKMITCLLGEIKYNSNCLQNTEIKLKHMHCLQNKLQMSSYLFHMLMLIGCESDGHFLLVQSPGGLFNPGVRFGLSTEEAEKTEGL